MKKRLILFLVGILLVFSVLHVFGINEVIGILLGANPIYIAAALGLQFVTMILLAARQRIIGGPYVPFWKAFRVVMSGNFINLVVPGPAVGGEPLKIYMLKNSYGSSKATAVIAIDDFIEILGTVLVVLFVLLFFAPGVAPSLTAIFVVFVIIIFLAMGVMMKLLLTPRWLKRAVDWLINKISKYQHIERRDYARMFYNAFTIILKRKRTLASALIITVVIKTVEFTVIMLSFASIGMALPWREVAVVWALIVVFLFIPWLPGSLGLVEFGASSALVVLGLSGTAAASGIVINRFISFWFVLFVGMLALYYAKGRGELPSGMKLKEVDDKEFIALQGNKSKKK